jgi:precorrin-3B methylase
LWIAIIVQLEFKRFSIRYSCRVSCISSGDCGVYGAAF